VLRLPADERALQRQVDERALQRQVDERALLRQVDERALQQQVDERVHRRPVAVRVRRQREDVQAQRRVDGQAAPPGDETMSGRRHVRECHMTPMAAMSSTAPMDTRRISTGAVMFAMCMRAVWTSGMMRAVDERSSAAIIAYS
jgi:hypothetical protein